MVDERERSLPARFWRRLFEKSARKLNARSGHFYTRHTRPKRAADVATWPDRGGGVERAAIVMQGPVVADEQFTLETLRLYRRFYPDTQLVLSTWADTSAALLDPIRELGVDVVFADKPEWPGLFNVNMQIASAARGVRHAVEAGAEWVMKTRPDQRLYDPNALRFLIATAEGFPVRTELEQRHRIIGVGHGSLKYALYHLTDQTVFGHASDMAKYWTPEFSESRGQPGWPADRAEMYRVPVGEQCRHAIAEVYFASRFFERIGRPLAWTMEDSWAAFRDHLCVVDYMTTDFYWVKSQTHSLHELPVTYDQHSMRREMNFREWFLLYSGQLEVEEARRYEGSLLRSFPEAVDRGFT